MVSGCRSIYILVHALHCIVLHCIALRCIALRCIALRCVALHCVALRCIALHCNAFAFALHCIAIHHITSRRKAKIALYTLHDIALHYIVLTYITLLSKALLLHFIGVIMLPVYAWDSRWFKMIQAIIALPIFSGPQSGRLPDTCRGQVLYLAGGGRGSDQGERATQAYASPNCHQNGFVNFRIPQS